MSSRETTRRLEALLAAHHKQTAHNGEQNEWAFFIQFRNNGGWSRNGPESTLDAFALNVWSGKQRNRRIGYEIKASRADFLRELDSPGKRAWGMEICNEFYFVCPPGVAQKHEIPDNCGLMLADKQMMSLRREVRARYREVRDLNMNETCAIARRTSKEEGACWPDPIWRYRGQEINEAELRQILTFHMEEEVRRRSADECKRLLEKPRKILARYAADFSAAGVPVPKWMEVIAERGFDDIEFIAQDWNAGRWASQLVSPGALSEGKDIEALLRMLRRVKSSVEMAEQYLGDCRSASLLSPRTSHGGVDA